MSRKCPCRGAGRALVVGQHASESAAVPANLLLHDVHRRVAARHVVNLARLTCPNVSTPDWRGAPLHQRKPASLARLPAQPEHFEKDRNQLPVLRDVEAVQLPRLHGHASDMSWTCRGDGAEAVQLPRLDALDDQVRHVRLQLVHYQ